MLKFHYPDVIFPRLKNKVVVWNLLNFLWKMVKNEVGRKATGPTLFTLPLVVLWVFGSFKNLAIFSNSL
jgi:hypothetical protein